MSTSILILPFEVPASGQPVISGAAIEAIAVPVESDASAHWVFGDSGSFVDKISGQVLTPQGAAPALRLSYLTMSAVAGNSLVTPYADFDDGTDTVCMVARMRVTNLAPIWGNMSTTSGDGGAQLRPGSGSALNGQQRAGTSLTATTGSFTATDWNFIVFGRSLHVGASSAIYVTHANRSRAIVAPSSPIVGTGVNLSVGNNRFTGVGGEYDIAEVIYYRGRYLSTELADLYTRRKAAMATRNIAVT